MDVTLRFLGLTAIHLVSAWGRGQARPLLHVDATLFEPVADPKTSAAAAAAALRHGAPQQRILLRQVALGAAVGAKLIWLRRGSSAEASFLHCGGLQGDCEAPKDEPIHYLYHHVYLDSIVYSIIIVIIYNVMIHIWLCSICRT